MIKRLLKKASRLLSDKTYIKLKYYIRFHKRCNLNNPHTFNEKLQWLKLYDRKPIYKTMVDKYEAKKYVADIIGEEHIIPTLGVWDKFEDIDFDKLPNQFVLKCTHDSGGVVIARDKGKLDKEAAKKKINQSLRTNYYWQGREWPYKNVKPRIIAEKYMVDESGAESNDYKIMCFNGEAKLIELHIGRFSNSYSQDFYDVYWNKTQISQGGSFATQSTKLIPEPACLKEMLRLSELLAKDIYHVRIDWYEIDGRLYFGEITFFDGSGFVPFDNAEDDLMLGSWIKLH